jgi:hypothetical protein
VFIDVSKHHEAAAVKNVADSGARWVDVPATRFPGWIAGFAARHGGSAAVPGPGQLTVSAPDGAMAECHPPFAESFRWPAGAGEDRTPAVLADVVAAHAAVPRTVGVLLVRLGGYAAGVFTGYPPALQDAKTGSRPVHGRSAAGGWSQQRFARRRGKQADEALAAAADTAVLVFSRWQAGGSALDAIVLGGDRRAVAGLRGEPRLARYLALATERFITVPDPRRSVLEGSPAQFTAVRIRLTSAGEATPGTPGEAREPPP